MKSILALLFTAALCGCSSTPTATATPPTVNFAAVSSDVLRSARQHCARAPAAGSCDFSVVRLQDPNLPPNAWQTKDAAGQPVLVITERMLQTTQTDDALAFVLAHEAAHHIAGHQNRALAQHGENLAAVLGISAGAADAEPPSPQDLEFEADALGARIAIFAGYDMGRAIALFDRSALWAPIARASTHPSAAERRARLLR